jgi:hypothetical protein
MSEPKAEIIHVHAMRLDDLGLAEDTASRALVFLRKGQNVEIRFAARTMLPGFAERLVSALVAGEVWPARATVKFVGDPDVLSVIRNVRDTAENTRILANKGFATGEYGPVEREIRPKQPPKGDV